MLRRGDTRGAHTSRRFRSRIRGRRASLTRMAILVLIAGSLSALTGVASPAQAQLASCGAAGTAGTCTVTVDANDFASGADLANFTYVINLDNSRYINPTTRKPDDAFPQYVTTESNSPIVREGDQDRTSVTLPDGRYLISVRSPDHKLWGKHFTLPDDAFANARRCLSTSPRRARTTRCHSARSASSCSRTTPGPTAPRI